MSESERNALTFTAYDLDLHLSPAQSGISAVAAISIRNDGAVPLPRLALQISSSLHWDSVSLLSPNRTQSLSFGHHRIVTDVDHTGEVEEAVVTLPQLLAPGATVSLNTLYSGSIRLSGERLTRIGAPARDAALADWDQIGQSGTYLRGFANVLWYPVAANPVLLGDGARLFEMAGEQKLRQSSASIRLRLTIEYAGPAPVDAFFNGQREPLKTSRARDDKPTSDSPGIATAEFPKRPLGFRAPNLFVSNQHLLVSGGGILEEVPSPTRPVVGEGVSPLQPYEDGAKFIEPLLSAWLGALPLNKLTLFDHDGQSFEDQSLLLTPLKSATAGAAEPVLVHSLSHAWFRSSYVWLDEGVPQFLSLLWLERTRGRDAAVAELEEQAHALALAESNVLQTGTSDASPVAGQSLVAARDDVYYRNKAAAVLFMLRSVAGDAALETALQAYRAHGSDEDPAHFQHALEAASGKDLAWFFNDWVYHDRGLPDLTIAAVSPRELPAAGGRQAGWLIAVEVANDGGAAADVPVTIRSGALTRTEHLRIGARSKASTRIVFEGTPEELIVNDGTVPEAVASTHTRQLTLR